MITSSLERGDYKNLICVSGMDRQICPKVTFWHHEARRVIPNCDPRDRFVYPYLTRMMDSRLNVSKLAFHMIYLEKCNNRDVCHFEFKRFDIIATCALSDEIK